MTEDDIDKMIIGIKIPTFNLGFFDSQPLAENTNSKTNVMKIATAGIQIYKNITTPARPIPVLIMVMLSKNDTVATKFKTAVNIHKTLNAVCNSNASLPSAKVCWLALWC